MNELKQFDERDLPIAIPPVDLAWADMRSKLETNEKLATPLLPKLALVSILMLSWLVITESTTHISSKTNNAPISGIAEETVNKSLGFLSTKERNTNSSRSVRKAGSMKKRGSETNPEVDIQDSSGVSSTLPVMQSDTTFAKKEIPKSEPKLAEIKTEEQEKKKTSKDWNFNGGLQWELQIPTTSAKGYFDGPDNTAQPWRSLVPAIWLQASQEKNMISFEFNPMFQQQVPGKIFRQQDYITQSVDTLFSNYESKSLYKLLGMSASLGYAKNIKRDWWVGGLLQGAFWQQALAHSDVKQDIILAPGNVQTRYYDYDYRVTDEWSYFSKFQVFVHAEALYRKPRWQAGLRTGFAFTPLSKGEGPGNSFRSSLFFRWKILK